MAYVDYENNGASGGYDDGENPYGGGQGISDPPARSASQPDPYNTVAGYYQSLLGRAPESNEAAMGWWNGTGGNLDAISAGIGGSAEGQAYKASHSAAAPTQAQAPAPSAPTASNGRTMDDGQIAAFVAQLAGMSGADPSLRNDPGYWVRRIKETGGLGSDNKQYWQNAGVGPTAFFNNPNREVSNGGGASAATPARTPGQNPGGYTDASSQTFLDEVQRRLDQLHQPQDNSIYELLKSLALTQAQKLQQAPYTPTDDAALITQYRQPLTQARDTAKQQAALDMSRRGITPTSGVYQDRMKAIDVAYEGGIAQGANQMGVNAVSLKNSNALQALQMLSGLNTTTNTMNDRTNALSDRALEVAKMFPDFDATRLDQLLRASGSDSPGSSAISSLTSLGNLNLNTIGMNNINDANNSAAWGKIIASILGSI